MKHLFTLMSLLSCIAVADLIENTSNATMTIRAGALEPGKRIVVQVRFTGKGNVVLRTGRGQERMSVRRQGEQLNWAVYTIEDEPIKPASHWWERCVYYPNGFFKDNFALSNEFRSRVNGIRARFHRDLDSAFIPLSVEIRQNVLRMYLDHILIAEMPSYADMAHHELLVELPSGYAIQAPKIENLSNSQEKFYFVDLSSRYNAVGKDARPGSVTVDGIPFELAPANGKGDSVVDLGQSWFREGTLSTYESPNAGTFGGRWYGALGGNVSRMQFRIPYRQYSAIYLLATCAESPERVPVVTAQFFRPSSGFPKNFTVGKEQCQGEKLHVIKIPVQPGELLEFSDRNTLEVELTGNVQVYRAWPDPNHFSVHGAGIPSGVKAYAMTLEVAPLEVDFQPEAVGNVWMEGIPSYRLKLSNTTKTARNLEVKVTTRSFDGEESLAFSQNLALPACGHASTRFDLPVKKYGWHSVELSCDGRTYRHYMTRVRRHEIKGRPFDSKGFMFGYWDNETGHLTQDSKICYRLWGQAGLESFCRGNSNALDRSYFPTARRWGFKYFWSHYRGVEVTPETPEAMAAYLKEREVHRGTHRISAQSPADFFEPVFTHVFAEPGGIGTHGTLPEFYGEPPRQLNAAEQEKYNFFKQKVITANKIFRSEYPGTKILLPWGDPVFCVPFLKDEETRNLFDGVAYDNGFFLRLPEQQLHQCSIHRIAQFFHYWNLYRKDNPLIVCCEGPCLAPITPGAFDGETSAAHTLRCALLLGAYGVNRQFSIGGSGACASYWGEQHYGGGAFSRINDVNPYPTYAAIATLTHHLRYMEFQRWVPTGSLSVYCLEFKDSRNGKLLHVLWTIRGKRSVRMRFSKAYDMMDNLLSAPVVSKCPIFVYGCDGKILLGEPDHSDALLGEHNLLLGNCADLFVRQSQDADDEYVNCFPDAIRRFPASMELKKENGGLSIALPHQSKDRMTMPYYTTLSPEKSIPIPGKATYLTLEVTAASDWGRVVYVLKDATGRLFYSVGQKNAWNGDDQPNASYFNFDGKRLLRFELPSVADYDNFRELGSTWWGSNGGKGIAVPPFSLEKIFLERRQKAMYVNSLEKCSEKPVVLGRLYAEYDSAENMKTHKHLDMPMPDKAAATFNPIAEIAKKGTLPATQITKVEHPEHYYDGTRGIFHFTPHPDAAYYEIYLSLNPNGDQAIQLGGKITKSGIQLNGFLADTDFYAFIIYYDRRGNQSKISAPFHFKLQDNFGNK